MACVELGWGPEGLGDCPVVGVANADGDGGVLLGAEAANTEPPQFWQNLIVART